MPRLRQEDGEFRKWIQTHTPAWELVWDRPNLATAATLAARHAVGLAGPDKPFYTHRTWVFLFSPAVSQILITSY